MPTTEVQTETDSPRKSKSTPHLNRDKFNTNKLYRTPPTPPLEKQSELEKSFKLDCIAVSNISVDYSRANPKLGSVIPPYNSLDDPSISDFVKNYGVRDYLKRNRLKPDEHESIAGRTHDKFFKTGAGFQYLSTRNQFGNGHHPEIVEGHFRYMAEQPRVMISYNNMHGYRRNIPKLRAEPPSTFTVDPRWYKRINSYSKHYAEEDLLEHFKNTYLIGYPFHDNNYHNFHPSVKYVITVKTSEKSQDEFEGNLGINIVSKNFDTGFIKLDQNIAVKQKYNEDGELKRKFFKKGQKDVFEFEDQDIRTISAIILSRDGKGDEVLYLDYIDLEIHKTYEKQSLRFPIDGWLRTSRQDKKTEELKVRFGKKNSIIVYPNEKPKYDYKIRISPQVSKDTEYTISIDYEIKEVDNTVDLVVDFNSKMPKTGKLVLRLNGAFGESEVFKFDGATKPIDDTNKLSFSIVTKDVGKIKSVSLLYENQDSKITDYEINSFTITDPNQVIYEFEVDHHLIKANKEKIIKSKTISMGSQKNDQETNESELGELYIKLVGHTVATSMFELKDPKSYEDGVFTFVKKEANIGAFKNVTFKFEGDSNYFVSLKSIKVRSDKGQEFSVSKNFAINSDEEFVVRELSKSQTKSAQIEKKDGELMIQIIGEKKSTDLFELKNPISSDDIDIFSKTDTDLGKIKNVLIKYQDKPEKKILTNFVEIIDPRGNTYKYKTEMTLKGGQECMLPRKVGNKTQVEETEPEEETQSPTPIPKQETQSISPSPPPPSKPKEELVEYSITVKKGAGLTEIPIHIIIYGEKGSTKKTKIEAEKNEKLIEINTESKFVLKEKDVGKISKISLDYEASGLKGIWYLNYVEIKKNGDNIMFPVEKGFTKNETLELRPGERPEGIDLKNEATNTMNLNKISGLKI